MSTSSATNMRCTCQHIWRTSCESLHAYPVIIVGKYQRDWGRNDAQRTRFGNSEALNFIWLKLHLNVCFRQSLMVVRGQSLFVKMRFLEGCNKSSLSIEGFKKTRPNAGLRPAGPRWIVGGVQFSWVHFSRLASRLRRSARRGQIVFQKTYKTFLR